MMTPARVSTFAVVAVTAVFFVDFCALVFDCGCVSLWLGASAACNIHAASGPHCPWCAHPLLGGGVAFIGTLLVQVGIVLGPGAAGLGPRVLGALLAFPVVSGAIGGLQGVLFGYWSR